MSLEQNRDVCQCANKTLLAYETIQIDRYNTQQTHTILQSQKEVMSICTSLLNCRVCSRRSELIMLIMAICRATLHGMESLLSPCVLQTRKDDWITENEDNTSTGKLWIGSWRLDNEDEIEVIRSLLTTRMSRLDALIHQVKGVVYLHNWLAHQKIVQEILDHFRLTTSAVEKLLST